MKTLGEKLKWKREKNGLSQQELANEAGVSIRTIQRIENGQNQPQGFTLRAICSALGIAPEDLFDDHLVENKGMIQALHLSTSAGVLLPLANILVPAILFLYNKNKYRQFDVQAKNLLLWQVVFSCLSITSILLGMLSKLAHVSILGVPSNQYIFCGWLSFFFFAGFIPLLITILIQLNGVKNYYPPIFKT